MNVRRTYLLALLGFGAVSVVDTALAVLAGATLVDWLTGAVGVVVLLFATAGFTDPETSGAPTETGPIFWIVTIGASLFVLSTAITWL